MAAHRECETGKCRMSSLASPHRVTSVYGEHEQSLTVCTENGAEVHFTELFMALCVFICI